MEIAENWFCNGPCKKGKKHKGKKDKEKVDSQWMDKAHRLSKLILQ